MPNGDSYVTGTVDNGLQTDILSVMYNTEGRLQFEKQFDGSGSNDKSLDVQSDADGNIYVTGLANMPEGAKYATIKYSYIEREGVVVYDTLNQPHHFANQLLVNFHPNLLNLSFIDDKNRQFAELSEVLPQNAIDSLSFVWGIDLRSVRAHLLKIYSDVTSADSLAITRLGDTIKTIKSWSSLLMEVPDGLNLETSLQSLHDLNSIVGFAQYCHIYRPFSDPYYSLQTSLHADANGNDVSINIEPAWELMNSGIPEVRVAIIDNLVWYPHEEFTSESGSKIEGGTNYYGTDIDLFSSGLDLEDYASSHATSCAGIIGASIDNDKGVRGIAGAMGLNQNTGVSLYSLGIGSDVGEYDEAAALEAILSGLGGYEINVANMSWGMTNASPMMYQQLREAWRRQCVLVAARGNSSNAAHSQLSITPATLRDSMILCVGGSGIRGWYNNGSDIEGDDGIPEAEGAASMFGGNMDIVAPGVSDLVKTTLMPTDPSTLAPYCAIDEELYGCFNNTSAAAPHAAGVAALMMSYYNIESTNGAPNNLAPDDVEALIEHYATDVAYSVLGYNTFDGNYDLKNGHGRLNAGAVLEVLNYPEYEIFHSENVPPPAAATTIVTTLLFDPLYLFENINGNNVGTYNALYRYKVTHNYHHEFPENIEIIGAWPRFSSVRGYSPVTNVYDEPWAEYSFDIQGNAIDIVAETYCWQLPPGFSQGPPTYIPDIPEDLITPYSLHLRNNDLVKTVEIDPKKGNLAVAPNPTTNSISATFPEISGRGSLFVEAMSGQMVYSATLGHGQHTSVIDVSYLPTGSYVCRLVSGSDCLVTKFIKH